MRYLTSIIFYGSNLHNANICHNRVEFPGVISWVRMNINCFLLKLLLTNFQGDRVSVSIQLVHRVRWL